MYIFWQKAARAFLDARAAFRFVEVASCVVEAILFGGGEVWRGKRKFFGVETKKSGKIFWWFVGKAYFCTALEGKASGA